jgi:hypothetical protein
MLIRNRERSFPATVADPTDGGRIYNARGTGGMVDHPARAVFNGLSPDQGGGSGRPAGVAEWLS